MKPFATTENTERHFTSPATLFSFFTHTYILFLQIPHDSPLHLQQLTNLFGHHTAIADIKTTSPPGEGEEEEEEEQFSGEKRRASVEKRQRRRPQRSTIVVPDRLRSLKSLWSSCKMVRSVIIWQTMVVGTFTFLELR